MPKMRERLRFLDFSDKSNIIVKQLTIQIETVILSILAIINTHDLSLQTAGKMIAHTSIITI